MNFFKTCFFILILLSSVTETIPQVQYNAYVEQLMELVNQDTVRKYIRELTGDTSCIIGGLPYTIFSRNWTTEGNIKAADYIYEHFQSYGITTWYQVINSTITNVLAKKTGTRYPNRYFIICAHYDDMPGNTTAPGADDNASGVSCVMEAARILKKIDLPYTIVFAAWDEEERNMLGSIAYADTAFRSGDSIIAVLNLDMIAYDGNNDEAIDIHTYTNCFPLANEFVQILSLYQPDLVPEVTTSLNGFSDHHSFLNKGYKAILFTEDNSDFNPYYHTVNENYSNINFPYFLKMVKGAVAGIVTWAGDFNINITHTPLNSIPSNTERTVTAVIKSSHNFGNGISSPKLYYKVNDGSFIMVSSVYSNLDTFKFIIPGQALGTTIKYYIAAQDSAGRILATLPEGGSGYYPPGSVPPPAQFEYQIINVLDVTIGNGNLNIGYPYFTSYQDSRTLMLYDAAEIIAEGGSVGNISGIGFYVSSASSLNMNGFNIKMQNFPGSSVTGWIDTGWTIVYSGMYNISRIGWHMITLQTPFPWNGTDNLLIEMCFDNDSSGVNTAIRGFTPYAGMVYHHHADNDEGCSLTGSSAVSARPNIKMIINSITQYLALNLKVYLEGFWDGTIHVSDTISIYLASGSPPFEFVDSQKVVMPVSGILDSVFTNISSGLYYIVLKHRNHIETWSRLPQPFAEGSILNLDFTNAKTKAYGENMIFSNGAYCIYGGDINQDGFVDGTDMAFLDNDLFGYISGYVITDVNGDGFVDGADMAILDNNLYNYIGVIKPGGFKKVTR